MGQPIDEKGLAWNTIFTVRMTMDTISCCRVCQNPRLHNFFHLGDHPLANSLLSNPNDPEQKYPLSLSWCQDCSLVQLNETVDPKVLFSQYVWVTGTSQGAREYAEVFCKELLERIELSAGDFVLEIASNDGTFLKPFRARGITVVGIDPAENIIKTANEDGIPTEPVFWGVESAHVLRKKYGRPRVIFARNVLPHVANTQDFVRAIADTVVEDGLVAIEVHYARTIQKELHYDSIYHEHLCYFTVESLERLLREAGLYVFDVNESPLNGGSIVVYASRTPKQTSPRLDGSRANERECKINSLEKWQEFSRAATRHASEFRALLSRVGGNHVVGWGATARSSTLLNYCGITQETIAEVADMNPLKQGLFTAGTGIPIRAPGVVFQTKPDLVVLLAWNFTDEIRESLQTDFSYSGAVITPLPGAPTLHPSS